MWICGHWSKHTAETVTAWSKQPRIDMAFERTCTGLHALGPPVINVSVVDSSAALEPSTARSTTTGSAGFVECAALRALYTISDH